MSSSANNKIYVKIGEAAKILGVSIDTLRRWEKAGKISAIRTPGGTRLYSISTLKKTNPHSFSENQARGLTTESLLKNAAENELLRSSSANKSSLYGIKEIAEVEENIEPFPSLHEAYSFQSTDSQSSTQTLPKTSLFFKVVSTKLLAASAAMAVLTIALTSWISASYLTQPTETQQFFKNNIASAALSPFHKLAEATVAVIDPQKAQQLGFAPPDPVEAPPGILAQNVNSKEDVLAVTSASRFLEVNTDTQINGSLFVRDQINNLSLEGTPSASTIIATSGDTTLTVTNDTVLDQNLARAASPTFSTLNLSATSNQLVMQSGGATGTLTWTPTAARIITLPDATTTLVGTDTTQTLTNKSLSGSSNTFTNIPNSGLTNSAVTVSAGTNLTGGGTVSLGGSISLALKSSPEISGVLLLDNGTAAAPSLAFTSDADTGLYRVGSNSLGLITGGTATSGITIDANGNVGVGIVSPTSTLHVVGTSNVTSNATVGGTFGVTGASTLSSTLGVTGATTLSSTLSVTGNSTFGTNTLFVNTTTGNVGIGTTSPNSTLNVIGGATIGGAYNSTAPTNGLLVQGNVGIGTTAPGLALEIAGSSRVSNSSSFFGSYRSEKFFSHADSTSGWDSPGSSFSTFGLDNDTKKEGLSSLSGTTSNTSTSARQIRKTTSSGDFSEFSNDDDYLELWFNISNVSLLNSGSNVSVEIGNAQDSQEYQWSTPITNISSGWNKLVYRLGDAEKTGTVDWNNLNYFRMFVFGNGSSTSFVAKIDDIKFVSNRRSVTPQNLSLNGDFGTMGNIGVGTVIPGAKLSVAGNIGIGISYATVAAPVNGLAVQGNIGIGTTSPTTALYVHGRTTVTNNILVENGYSVDIASSSQRIATGYFDTVDATNLAGTVTGGSTSAASWTINSDNATNDAEDMALTFERGTASPNASLTWNSTTAGASAGYFGLNSGLIMTGTITGTNGLNLGSFTNDIVTPTGEHLSIIPGTGGNVGIGTTSPSQYFQINYSNSNPFVVTTGGNVGIGFTTPDRRLQTASDINIVSSNASLLATGGTQFSLTGDSSTGLSKKLVFGIDTTDNYGVIQAGNTSGSNYNISLNPAGGNVGIGITSPKSTLHVSGTSQFTGHVGIGASGYINTDFAVNIDERITSPTGGGLPGAGGTFAGGISLGVTVNPSSTPSLSSYSSVISSLDTGSGAVTIPSTTTMEGLLQQVRNMGTGNVASLTAIIGSGQNNSTGSVTDAYGVAGRVANWNTSGTITNAYGLYSYVWAVNGPITNRYGLYIKDGAGTAGNTGTIGTNYGIYLENQTKGITDYSIYSAGGANYFAGNLGIGTSAGLTRSTLGVSGNTGIGSNFSIASSIPTNGLAVEGNTGIGTTTANNKLSVVGGVNISTDFQSITAPTAGLFVQGNAGIGATTSSNKLDVWGDARVTGSLTVDSTLTGNLFRASNGSASAPAYSFTNLTTAGVWTNGDGILLTAGGTATRGVAVTNAGNVGVGTTAPIGKLQISSGQLIIPDSDGTNVASLAFAGATPVGLYRDSLGLVFTNGGNQSVRFGIIGYDSIPGVSLNSYGALAWTNGDADATRDLYLYRDAANVLAQRNDTTAQEFRIYNTYTSSTSNEFGKLEWASNVFNIGTEKGSAGGTARALGLLTDNTERLRITTNGNVGIGTSAVATGVGGKLIVTDGNVGIGTTSPTALFQVFKTGTNDPIARFGSPGGIINDSHSVTLENPTGQISLVVAGGASDYMTGLTQGDSGIRVSSGDDFFIGTNDTMPYLSILSGGNIGIGATTANSKLYVNGGLSIGSGFNTAAPTNGLLVQGNAGFGTISPTEAVEIKGPSTTRLLINAGANTFPVLKFAKADVAKYEIGVRSTTDDLYFYETDAGLYRMVIQDGGNVGIGVTTANSLLSVSGNAHIGSVRQGITAPTDGLFVDGNVGIGATTSSNKLDVWGNARITGTLTVDGALTTNGSITPTGQFLAQDGTAAAPGYSFTGDTDSGLWRAGTNQIALTTAGSAFSGLSVNSSGNVGIGTSSATGIFQVSAPAATSGTGGSILLTAQQGASGGNNGGAITLTSGSNNGTGSTGAINLTVSSGTGGEITGGAISLTAGNSSGSNRTGGAITLTAGSGANNTGTGGAISLTTGAGGGSGAGGGNSGALTLASGAAGNNFGGSSNTSSGTVTLASGNGTCGGCGAGITSGSGNVVLRTGSNVNGGTIGTILFQTNGSNTRMVVDGNGNIGIGATLPTARLSIQGNVGIGYTSVSIPANGLAVSGNVGIGITTANSLLSVAGGAHIGSVRQGIAAPTDGLFVDGNVGIGATTSSNKLDVWGNARITGTLTVDGSQTFSGSPTFSGQILASDGSASLPGYSFTNDTDSGLWRIGTNLIALTTNTSPQTSGTTVNGLSIDSDGNVGIGTTTNGVKLEVAGTARFSGNITSTSDLLMNGVIRPTSGYLVLRTAATGHARAFNFQNASGTEIATINTSGGLLLGTTGFGNNTLDVSGGAAIGTYAGAGVGSTAPQNGLIVSGNVGIGTSLPIAKLEVSGGNILLDNNRAIQFRTAAGTPASVYTVDSADQTRINNTSGQAALIAGGSITNLYGSDGGAAVASLIGGRVGLSTASPIARLHSTGAGTSTGLNIVTTNSTNSTFGLAVLDNGNVGIGTSTANAALHVNGAGLIGYTGTVSGAPPSGLAVSGNVGIGTTSATSNLTVVSTSNSSLSDTNGYALTVRQSTTQTGALSLGGDNSYQYIQSFGGTPLQINNQGNNVIFNAGSQGGNIGIGTVSPVAQLDVRNTNTSTGLHMYVGSSAGQFAILDNGNVGIGTTNPGIKFDVSATSATAGRFTATGANVLSISRGSDAAGSNGFIIFDRAGTRGFIGLTSTDVFTFMDAAGTPQIILNQAGTGESVFNEGANNVDFRVEGQTNPTLFFVDASANSVGIGTTAPGSTLTVVGNSVIGYGSSVNPAGPSNGLAVSGNVGIGTTTAAQKLVVSNSGDFSIQLEHSGANGNEWSISNIAGTNLNGGLRFYDDTNASERFRITNNGIMVAYNGAAIGWGGLVTPPSSGLGVSGNVGIGKTTTAYNLDVLGTGRLTSQLVVNDERENVVGLVVRASRTPNTQNIFQLYDHNNTLSTSVTSAGAWSIASGLGVTVGNLQLGAAAYSTALYSAGSSALNLGSSGTNPVRVNMDAGMSTGGFQVGNSGTMLVNINSDGNVGIGATTPISKLGVAGNAAIGSNYGWLAAPTNGLIVEGNVGIGFTSPTEKLTVADGNDGSGGQISARDGGFIGMAANGQFPLQLGNNTTGIQDVRFRINPNGDIDWNNNGNVTGPTITLPSSSAPLNILSGSSVGILSGNLGVGVTSPSQRFQVNTGSSATVITSSGNVGIGATTSANKLDVWGNARIAGTLTLDSTLTSTGVFLAPDGTAAAPAFSFANDTNTGIFRPGTDALGLSTGGSSRLTVTAGGNVGIGITSPNTIFEIFKPGATTSGDYANKALRLTEGMNTVNKIYSKVAMYDDTIYGADIGLLFGNAAGNQYNLVFSVNDDITGNPVEAMRIVGGTGTGNIGIGTAAPSQIFQVNANTSNPFVVTSGGNVGIGFSTPANRLEVAGAAGGAMMIQLTSGATDAARRNWGIGLDNNAYGNLEFMVSSAAGGAVSQTPKVVFDSTGNVGINNNAPKALLQLNTSGTSTFTVNTSGNVGIGTSAIAGTGTRLHLFNGLSGVTPYSTSNLVVEDDTHAGIAVLTPSASVGSLYFGNPTSPYAGGFEYYQTGSTDGVPQMQVYINAVSNLKFKQPTSTVLGSTPIIDVHNTSASVGVLSEIGLGYRGETYNFSSSSIGAILISAAGNTASDIYFATRPAGSGDVAPYERMRINSAGNLGIGNSAPNAGLQLSGNATIGYGGALSPAGPSSGLAVSGNIGIGATTANSNLFVNGGATIGGAYNLTAPTNGLLVQGNVGIGTTAPGSTLTVVGNSVIGYGSSVNPAGPSNGLAISGNVGIGTTTADRALEVIGTIRSSVADFTSGLILRGNTPGSNRSSNLTFTDNQSTAQSINLRKEGSQLILIGTNAATNRFGIDADGTSYSFFNGGNVGIGPSTPIGRLDIQGTGTSTGITLTTRGSNGTQGLTVLDNGNVGIGTTGPTGVLHVVGGAGTAAPITLIAGSTSTSTAGAVNIYSGGTVTGGGTRTTGAINLTVAGAGVVGSEYVGGAINLTAGNSSGSNNTGGAIILTAGGGANNTGTGGAISLTTGAGGGSGAGGGNSGALTLASGASGNNFGGGSLNTSGNVTLTSGDGAGGGGNSNTGNVILKTGSLAGTGTAGTILFQTNGANTRMFIDHAGNVGIGASNPATAKLSVQGNVGIGYTSVAIPINGLAVSGNVGIGITTANSTLSVAGSAHIGSVRQGVSAPTDGLFVDGNVGIGATTSSNKLDVWGNARVTGSLTVDGSITSSSSQYLAADGSASSPSFSFVNDADTGLWRPGTNMLALTTAGSPQSSQAINGLSINSSGNVGIGTTSSTARLDLNFDGVSGTSEVKLFNIAANANNYTFTGSTNLSDQRFTNFDQQVFQINSGGVINDVSTVYIAGAPRRAGGSGSQAVHYALRIAGGAVSTGSISTRAYGLYVDAPVGATSNYAAAFASGNVGIGTTIPNTAKLQIAGAGTTTGLSFLTTDITGTQRFAILDNGNVGIGTTNPTATLQIQGNVGIGYTGVTIPANGLAVNGNIGIGLTSAQTKLHVWGDNTNSAFFMNGNVGIGTTAPAFALSLGMSSQTLGIQNQTTSNTAGGSLTLRSGAGNGSGAGGTISLAAGAGGASGSGTGGAISLAAGAGGNDGVGNSAGGGAISITAGAAGNQANATGGALSLAGGAGTGANNGGAVTIAGGNMVVGTLSGAGSGTGGTVTIRGGNGTTTGGGTVGPGGAVSITGGNASTQNSDTGVVGGAVSITGGAGGGLTSVAGNGGALTFTGGTPNATGTGGAVSITTGAGGSTSGTSGTLTLATGTTTSGLSGAITIRTGAATGANAGGILFQTNGANSRMAITPGGNVGIGITNPIGALQVNGAAGIGYGSLSNSSFPSNGLAVSGNIGIGATTVNSALYINGGATIGSGFNSATAPTNGLLIQGNVGIGTTSATSQLTFRGVDGVTPGGVNFTAGSTNSGGGAGGAISFTGGEGGPSNARGGAITLTGGAAGGGNNAVGGNIVLIGGTSNNTNSGSTPGAIIISGGNGTGTGAISNAGGGVFITGGAAANGAAIRPGGDVRIVSGASPDGSAGTAGALYLATGNTTSTVGKIVFAQNNILRAAFDTSGNLGIGVTNPGAKFTVAGSVGIGVSFASSSTIATDGLAVQGSVGIGTTTVDANAKLTVVNNFGAVPSSAATVITVGSSDGTTGGSSIRALGSITGNLADFGEYFPFIGNREDYEFGDLVVTTLSGGDIVERSNSHYQNNVLGIVTRASSFIAGADSNTEYDQNGNPTNRLAVALLGRVPLKVSTENGAIKPGDFLTSSSIPGVAMKATRPGQVVGKALESFDGSNGEACEIGIKCSKVLTFVSASFADPSNFFSSLSMDEEGNLIMPKLKVGKLSISPELAVASSELTTDGTQIVANEDSGVDSTNPGLASSSDTYDVAGKIATLEDTLKIQESRVKSLEERLAQLEASDSAQIAGVSTESTDSATPSADLASELDLLNLTDPSVLLASDSANLIASIDTYSDATFSGVLTAYQAQVQDSLKVYGNTTLSNTNIAGDLNVDGTLSIETGNTINVVGTLFLQKALLADKVDIFDGKIVIGKDGNIQTVSVTADQFKVNENKSAGSAKILSGQTEIVIDNPYAEENSIIVVTPNTPLSQTLAVVNKSQSQFTVKLLLPETQDINFDYVIIGVAKATPGVISQN